MRHPATLGVTPPRDKRDRVQVRRFLRALLARWLVVNIAMWSVVLLVVGASSVVVIAAVGFIALNALDVLWLGYQVRRDERQIAAR